MAIGSEAVQVTGRCANRLRQILVIDERDRLAESVAQHLLLCNRANGIEDSFDTSVNIRRVVGDLAASDILGHEVVVFSPLRVRWGGLTADVDFAESVFNACRDAGVKQLVLISSSEIYGSDYSNPGMVREKTTVVPKRPNSIAATWAAIEELAVERLDAHQCCLSIVRPCFVLSGDRREFASRLFQSRLAFTIAGYDPCIQLLDIDDLASAIAAVVSAESADVYNVAPREVLPLRKALRLAGVWRIPVPYSIQRAVRAVLAPLGLASTTAQIEFLRYPWTVSNQKLSDEFGIEPQRSSAEAIVEFKVAPDVMDARTASGRGTASSTAVRAISDSVAPVDDFGLDEQYIRSCGRWQLGFMERVYWRVEVEGLEQIPAKGGAVLAGIHRGFMPFDGVMLVHLMSKYVGRVPRFLMHPGLVKFPHLAGFLTRLGGIIACQENADSVLKHEGILGVFPEGIRGAFRLYNRDVYKLGKQRDDYVKAALSHRVPIIPFVTIGPAETFPILGKVEWSWWKRHTHWPFFPITPTGNLLPLPTKWHIRFLEAIPTDHYGAEAAKDRELVRELCRRVHLEMQAAIDELLSRRRSIFFGSILERKHPDTEPPRTTAPIAQASVLSIPRVQDTA